MMLRKVQRTIVSFENSKEFLKPIRMMRPTSLSEYLVLSKILNNVFNILVKQLKEKKYLL